MLFPGRRRRDQVQVFNSSVKPALESLGFFGERGWVTEEIDFLDTLYFLRDISKVFQQSSDDSLKELFERHATAIQDGRFDREGASVTSLVGNYYRVGFHTACSGTSQKGLLSLTVSNADRAKWGDIGTEIFQALAPISYFNKTNLLELIERAFHTCIAIEENRAVRSIWLIHGLPNNDKQGSIGDLSPVYPEFEEDKSYLKSAVDKFRLGYSI